MLCVCKIINMSCKFRYCLVVFCVFLIEVFLSSIWTSFGALTINNFICSSKNNCKYEDNAWLLLFFICLCRILEMWVELHCRYLHIKRGKSHAIFTHQKFLYSMPLFLIVVLVVSCYLPYGPHFMFFGLSGGILVGIISAHVKFYTKVFHDKDISERQYDFILHLGRSTSLMLTCVLLPLAIRHYYGVFTTRLLLAILLGNVFPLVMIIRAGRTMPKTKHATKVKHNSVRYEAIAYDSNAIDVEPPVVFQKIEDNLPPLGKEFERDLQVAIHASIRDSRIIPEQLNTQAFEEVKAWTYENEILEEKCETEARSEIIKQEDLDKIENVETSVEKNQLNENMFTVIEDSSKTVDITPKRFSWADFEFSSDSSSGSGQQEDLDKIKNVETSVEKNQLNENILPVIEDISKTIDITQKRHSSADFGLPSDSSSDSGQQEDLDKIENVETAVEKNQLNENIPSGVIKNSSKMVDIPPKRFSWADFGHSSDSSSDSLPPYSTAVIYGHHTVQIHANPSSNSTTSNASSTSTVTSGQNRRRINMPDLCQIEILPEKPRQKKAPRPSLQHDEQAVHEVMDFQEFSDDYCRIRAILSCISCYPSILSVLYSNQMCLIYLASFPFMVYQLRLQQENSTTETVEEATFFSLFFLGLCWHAILWFLYYFPKYIFVKYVFGLVILGSCLLLYFLTEYVSVTGPLFGLGYGITSYLEKDLYAHFTQSDCPEPIIFNFRITTAFLSLATCAILPVLARYVTILSVYSAVPFFVLAIGLLAFVKQKVYDEQQTLLPVKRKHRKNYRTTTTETASEWEWKEENECIAEESVASSDANKAAVSSGNTWGNWMHNMLMSGNFPQQSGFHDVFTQF